MRSLFLKIFVWFWAAMALVGGVLVVSILLQQGRQPPPPPLGPGLGPFGPGRGFERRRAFTGNSIAHQARRGAMVYRREGAAGLAGFLEKYQETSGIEPSFFDSQGRELSGRKASEAETDLARRALESGEVEFQGTWSGLLVAASAGDDEGGRYAMVGLLPRRLLGWGLEPADLALRFLAVLVTGGVLCYGLARYLTAPMSKLQRATRQLAAGDLATRVGEDLGGRQDEFGDLGRDFDRMAERIQQLVGSQNRLLGDISHELRSPLARMTVALELARKKSGAEATASLDRIGREAERMNELIGHLLRLTRLESDDQSLDSEVVELEPLLREISSDAHFEAVSRGRSVRFSADQACITRGSAGLLRSAIENVVRNAVRHTAEGTVVDVFLSEEKAPQGERQARITVRDRGAGVPPESLPHLFRPFYRVDDARDRGSGGAGLGLAIADRIIRRHRGEMRAANDDGGGLRVEIFLPL